MTQKRALQLWPRPLSEPQGSPPRSETCRIRLPGNTPLTRKRYTSLTWPTKNDWVGMLSYWPFDLKQVWTAQIPTQNLMEDVAEITVLVNLENGRWLCGITWNSKTSKDDWGHTQCNFILKHERNQWKAKVAFQDHWSGQKNFKMHWEITKKKRKRKTRVSSTRIIFCSTNAAFVT